MSWKKNTISYIMWFFYVLLTEALVLVCADSIGRKMGLSVYMSALFALLFVALIGVIVLLIRYFGKKSLAIGNAPKVLVLVAEAAVQVLLIALGLYLRISNIESMTQNAAYFEAAQVTYGQSIPQVVHGAVYLYLQVLHGLFTLVGNHFGAGIWLQIVLQILAFWVLYGVVKKVAGTIAALITLAFGMCGPLFVQQALTLSPEILYFFFLVLILAIFMSGCGRKLHPPLFMVFGGLAAVMTYLDIAGVLLFFFAVSMVFMVRQENSKLSKKIVALAFCVVSYVGIFLGSIFLDAFVSDKKFLNVLRAWWELYTPKTLALTEGIGEFPLEDILIVALLVVGIFSFWCNKEEEKISFSIFFEVVFLLGMNFFTEEMPVDFYLYVALIVIAGAGVGQVFQFGHPEVLAADSDGERAMIMEDIPDISEVLAGNVEEILAEEAILPKAKEEQEAPSKPAIQFIENPLPLPKKHEKKVLDYAVNVTKEADDYDIHVADDDDYDK